MTYVSFTAEVVLGSHLISILASRISDGLLDKRAISHLAILPPHWAMLPSDLALYTCPPPVRTPPSLIKLTTDASCRCIDGGWTFYNPGLPVEVKRCTVYTLTGAFPVEVKTQKCPRCPPAHKRRIGPEPRALGLFNYNNWRLFSHELLDDYTCSFTTSETPFESWVNQVDRQYAVTESPIPFLGSDTFGLVWFAYARLMKLEGDKQCTRCGVYPRRCGVYPRNVIWDGVSISFSRKHVKTDLEPLTIISLGAPSGTICKALAKQEWIQDRSL